MLFALIALLQANAPAGVDYGPALQVADQELTRTLTSSFPLLMKIMMAIAGISFVMWALRKVTSGGN